MSSSDWTQGPRPSSYGQLSESGGNRAKDEGSADFRFAQGRSLGEAGLQGDGWTELLNSAEPREHLDQSRDAFVREQLKEAFADDKWQRRLLSIGTTCLIGALCWRGGVSAFQLGIWLACRLILSQAWHWSYVGPGPRESAQSKRHIRTSLQALIAGVSGSVLGASVLLFFGRIPIGLQFVCWITIMAAIILPIHTMALDPLRIRSYAHGLFVTIFACVLYRVYTADERLAVDVLDRHYEVWFLAIPLVQWMAVGHIAERVLANARKGFELAFYKRELIRSLADGRHQAEEAVKLKNRFLADAAHDMRQPVTALAIYVDHLMEVPGDQPLVLPKIARATAAVNRLFDSLFDLARIDNGQLKAQPQPLNISEVLSDLWEQYAPIAEAKGVAFKMHNAKVELETDPALVRRMIGNVVSNAIKYTPSGKKVLLSARLRGSSALVEVWDQGIGLSPEELAQIFQEFYRAPGAAENADGYGLGLPIVARLAHALNTRLTVRSEAGRGTVFRLELKSHSGPPTRARSSAEA